MGTSLRQSMNLLHTWCGVIVGALLFAIFWMGTLSVFDREIDRWMEPMTRLAQPAAPIPFEALRSTYDAAAATKAAAWTMLQVTDRQPVIRIVYREAASRTLVDRYFDPVTGAALPYHETLAGTKFIYPFHYNLHLRAWDIGEWIVGAAAMVMLLMCVSGVIFHRRLFVDFFTFQPDRPRLRTFLDAHTVAGGLGLPFYVIIALSGLFIHFAVYFPSAYLSTFGDRQAFQEEAGGGFARPKANKPGTLASLDAMAAEARRLWNGVEPWAIVVRHPGDAAAFVTVFQSFDSAIPRYAPAIHFDAVTGAVLHQSPPIKPMMKAQRFMSGLHQIQFTHWTLRFTYFALGLLGCGLIATGFLFWIESRRKRHGELGLSGVRIVEALTVGSTAGIVVATAAFLVINRVLPLGTTFLGVERAALEIWTFWLVWIATFAHAWFRPRVAWAGQFYVIALLAVSAVILNWLTTGDHLVRSLAETRLWAVAGVDVALLLTATVALLAARRLGRAAASADPGIAANAKPHAGTDAHVLAR